MKKTQKPEYCKNCRYMVKPDNHCICIDMDKKTEETLLKIEEMHLKKINELAKSFPNDYITTEYFYESGFKYNHKLKRKDFHGFCFLHFPIGLFKCVGCGRIISHNQYAYSRCCGSCNVGKRNKPPYKILFDFEIPREKERIDNEIQRMKLNIKDLQRLRRI